MKKSYRETLDWMFQQLPLYQRQGKTAFKKDLNNIRRFSNRLDNPERKFKSIHVGGTNGKGSTAHMLASVFQEAGYKTGLYTSPHLKDFRERIKINGKEVSEDFVIHFIIKHRLFLAEKKLSFFEMSVGMAFDYFADEKVDIAIVEVGLGGRLDSTNILTPILSVITNIGLDHTQFLGSTKKEIATEKAGIIKENTPVIVGERSIETTPVFEAIAQKRNAPLFFAEDTKWPEFEMDLKGVYQRKNRQTTLNAIALAKDVGFKLPDRVVRNGLKNIVCNTDLKGRWQILGQYPKIIADTAHNKEGLNEVIPQLLKEEFQTLHIVLGVVNDKDLLRVLPIFPKKARYYFCEAGIPRKMPAKDLQREALVFGLKGDVFKTVKSAYENALDQAGQEDVIYVGGSTFTVAEII